MSEVFTSYTVEVYISGVWVNITADVRKEPPPHWGRGAMSNEPEKNRVADGGSFTFSLDNGIGNSAGLNGYYSPGHTNCRAGWAPGLPVRLSFSYAGFTKYVWRGAIEPDGIKITPGVYGTRDVSVSCIDFMGQLAYHRMDLLAPQTSLTASQAVDAVLSNISIAPLNKSYILANDDVMPYLFDTQSPESTGLGQLYQICASNNAYIFVRGNATDGETLVLDDEAPNFVIPTLTVTNLLLLETGDQLLLEDGSSVILDNVDQFMFTDSDYEAGSEFTYNKYLFNQVTVIIYPRRIDAAATTVLYSLEKATQLGAGESLTFRGTYKDPTGVSPKVNCKDFTYPLVASTDYFAYANADGTGTNYTANMSVTASLGAAEAEFTVTNNGASAFYFGGPSITFQLRGKGIYLDDPVRIVKSDDASIATYGLRPLTLDMKYYDDVANAPALADYYLSLYTTPRYFVDKLVLTANKSVKNMLGFMFVEPFLQSPVSDTMTGIASGTNDKAVFGYEAEIIDGKTVKWYPVLGYSTQTG